MKDQSTRREFLKAASLGAGLLICNKQMGCAQLGWGPLPIAPNNPSIQHHMGRCRFCGDCREFCRSVTTVLGQQVPQGEDACIHCGQCIMYCRVALTEKFHFPAVATAIAAPNKIVVASTSPAIRVSLGEMYRLDPGTNVEGKTVGAMKKLGVDHVLDTTFAADLAIMEEASELLRRLQKSDTENPLPMFTSCCPSWVRFVKLFYPMLLPNLSTAKSPVLMQGTMVKTYFAQKMGIDPEKIVHIALTPCTAKKAEIMLPDMNSAGISLGKPEIRDVDIALTCREIAYLLKASEIDFLQVQDATYSSLMGAGSGASMIFGNTGGVMEAALRTAYKLLNDKNPPADFFDLRPIRGWESVRHATVDLGKRTLNVAVVHGIGKTRPFIDAIQSGEQKFDFVEVMACPGGCIGGGGQPYPAGDTTFIQQLRLGALFQRDANQEIRLSCDNPQIKAVYGEFLGEPLGKKSEALLHVGKRI